MAFWHITDKAVSNKLAIKDTCYPWMSTTVPRMAIASNHAGTTHHAPWSLFMNFLFFLWQMSSRACYMYLRVGVSCTSGGSCTCVYHFVTGNRRAPKTDFVFFWNLTPVSSPQSYKRTCFYFWGADSNKRTSWSVLPLPWEKFTWMRKQSNLWSVFFFAAETKHTFNERKIVGTVKNKPRTNHTVIWEYQPQRDTCKI